MKILQMASGTGINGAFKYCSLLSDELVRRSHDVTALCHPESWLKDQFKEAVTIEPSNHHRTPWSLWKLARWIRRSGFDLMHTHNTRAHHLGAILRYLTGVPVIATAHSQSIQLHWRFNDLVIANSDATRAYHRRFNRVADAKMRTVYCFTDIEQFFDVNADEVVQKRRELGIVNGDFVVGLVGVVEPRKNALCLIRALPKIVDALPNTKVLLVGPYEPESNYFKELQSELRRSGMSPYVHWLGGRDDVPALMHLMDIVTVPSLAEPLGLVAIEALATETPVVAADVGGLPEIVVPEENGLLVNPRNSNALAESIIRLGNDSDLRRRMGKSGRDLVSTKFDVKTLSDQVEAVYQETTHLASTQCP